MTRTTSSPTAPQRALFVAFASTGSVKEAAHLLGVSESAATRRLQRMYRRIGAVNGVQAAWILWGVAKDTRRA